MDPRYATQHRHLDAKAARLTVRYLGGGLFLVSDPLRHDD